MVINSIGYDCYVGVGGTVTNTVLKEQDVNP
jgi:hypothetical protein